MIALSPAGCLADVTPAQLEEMRAEFASLHTLKLEGFLSPPLLHLITPFLSKEAFYEHFDGIARELKMQDNVAVHLLRLQMNDSKLHDQIRAITGCEGIHSFKGRIYRMQPGGAHRDDWHDDDGVGRLIGMSINLSPEPYGGGTFQIKYRDSDTLIRTVPNLVPGDAILFRLGENLLHRITPMEGTRDKTAFAGWFHSQNDFADFLKQPASQP
ncbi:MAG TPA: 2OG-Fe(II) oxygenase [Terriglobales bacterium]|nr:2OG-Fe(II) oxygenase [Terriglobales bacterium]